MSLAATVCLLDQAHVRADQPWALFGDASFVRQGQGGNPWAVSLTSASTGYAGVDFLPRGSMNFLDLTQLSTEYNATVGGLGGGSVRFAIGVDVDHDGNVDGSVFIYLGTPPNFNNPAPTGWQDSGNLIGSTEPRFDSTQLGGKWNGDYAATVAVIGNAGVVSIDLVVDGGWLFPVQTVLVDDIRVNDFTLSAKGAAKK
jgi:hypothetical protein